MWRLVPALVSLVVLAGCHDQVTEEGVVMPSDRVVPADADAVGLSFNPGPFPPSMQSFDSKMLAKDLRGLPFPLSIGFTSGGATPNFSITVQLFHGVNQGGTQNIVVGRTATDIRFVDEKTMML